MTAPRLSFVTLEEQLERRHGRRLTNEELAALLHVKRLRIIRMRASGIQLSDADKYAVAAGFHPSSIWGLDWWKYKEN